MTSEQLVNYVSNERDMSNSVIHNVKMLRMLFDRAANNLAKANAEWHDDPAAEDHAEFHAPAEVQFPREVRDEAIKELVSHWLTEFTIQES